MLNKKFVIGLLLAFLALGFVLFLISHHFKHSAKEISFQDALLESKKEALAIKNVRACYTSEVIGNVIKNGTMDVSHDYENKKYDSTGGAVPLPATFSMELAKRMSSENEKVELYSIYPFPWRKDRKISDFQKRAWEFFEKTNQKTETYFEKIDSTNELLYAIPDRMVHISCVKCHNTHPETPKADWKLGDLRGVISIQRKMRSSETIEEVNDHMVTLMICSGGILVMIFIGTLMFSMQSFKEVSEAKDKTQHLLEDSKKLGALLSTKNNEIEAAFSQIKISQNKLVESEKLAALGHLVSGVSHELNTPLGALKASLDYVNDETKEALKSFSETLLKLNKEEVELFMNLVDLGGEIGDSYTTKEERVLKKKLRIYFEEMKLKKSEDFSEAFLDMQIFEGIDKFKSLIIKENGLKSSHRLLELFYL